MIIKYCLAIAAKSPSAYYRELRFDKKTDGGILILPSQRTLQDYKNVIRPERGFNPHIITDLKLKTSEFSELERYLVRLFDEMEIQEDLVWDKNTGDLIGFVDQGDINVNYATLKNVQDLASHVLVFMVKSVVNTLSYSLATFATHGTTARQLYPFFWKAVAVLEISCQLNVIATTSDGASPNRRFFKMHKVLHNYKFYLFILYLYIYIFFYYTG